MTTYRVWIDDKRGPYWIAVDADSSEEAVKRLSRAKKSRVLRIKPVVKRGSVSKLASDLALPGIPPELAAELVARGDARFLTDEEWSVKAPDTFVVQPRRMV